MRLIGALSAVFVLAACTSQSPPAPSPDAAAQLQAIPAVDPATYQRPRDMREWQNPYLVVRTDGIGLLDAPNNLIHVMKPEEVPDALAKLPASAWPYGRVVAIAEASSPDDAESDRATIRKNRAIVSGTLRNLNVLIHWIPTS